MSGEITILNATPMFAEVLSGNVARPVEYSGPSDRYWNRRHWLEQTPAWPRLLAELHVARENCPDALQSDCDARLMSWTPDGALAGEAGERLPDESNTQALAVVGAIGELRPHVVCLQRGGRGFWHMGRHRLVQDTWLAAFNADGTRVAYVRCDELTITEARARAMEAESAAAEDRAGAAGGADL
jgi:hypothetical protein